MDTPADRHHKLVVIGSGPAGLTAAIYSARAELKPLVIEGIESGGQLMNTTEVENFPGFPEGLVGPELMMRMREQAERFGAQFVTDDVTGVDFSARPLRIDVSGIEYTADTVIVSTGATARSIGIESEQKLAGHGVSYCATCDGYFFKQKDILVVGGGDSAMEEATFLTKFGQTVTIVHRRDEYRASAIMLERARQNPKIRWREFAEVVEVLGDGEMTGARLRDTRTGEESVIEAQGLFVAIGHTPNTTLFADQLELDEHGYIVTRAPSSETNVSGVFACGDVQDHTYRQAITAAGSGCTAALDAERYLAALDEATASTPAAQATPA